MGLYFINFFLSLLSSLMSHIVPLHLSKSPYPGWGHFFPWEWKYPGSEARILKSRRISFIDCSLVSASKLMLRKNLNTLCSLLFLTESQTDPRKILLKLNKQFTGEWGWEKTWLPALSCWLMNWIHTETSSCSQGNPVGWDSLLSTTKFKSQLSEEQLQPLNKR